MRRAAKFLGWTLAVLVLPAGAAAAAAYVFVTSDYVRAQIENHANALSGRKTKIGKLAVDWGWVSHFHLEDVELSNTDWGKADHMFKAKDVEIDIRLWPLIRGDLVLPRLVLRRPEVYLERNQQDQSNWSPAESPVASAAVRQVEPKQRHETPLIGRLEIDDGRVSYIDQKRKLDVTGTVQTATGEAGGEPRAELALKGKLEGEPLSLHFVGGSVLMLRQTEKPYPVDLEVNYGETRLSIKGTLQDPFQYKGANLQLSLAGQDLSQIYPLLGIPGPPTPPYRISGNLENEPGIWRVTKMAWHAGDSDLSGEVTIDRRQKPSHLTAKLASDRLVFADLAPLVGATPGKRGNVSPQQRQTETELEAKGELFPNIPLHVERLRAMNMDVSLDAKRVIAPDYLPVHSLAARFLVQGGQATVEPLTMSFGGGSVTGQLGVDARTDTPTARANLRFHDVSLAEFFRGSRYFDTTKGRLQGQVILTGNGRSLAQVMGTATGNFTMAMTGGSVSDLMVSLAGTQIADALVLYITGDHQIPIRCALGRLSFNHGTVAFQNTLMDTRKSVLHVDGNAALGSQMVNVKITADPKVFDLLDLHAPVLVAGKIRSPKISIGRKIPIPTPDFGGAKDVACDQQIQELLAAKP